MKKRKYICYIVIMINFILSMLSYTWATNLESELKIIEQSSEIKYLENNQGYISKTIVDSNKDTGEVTIELKLSNTKKEIVNKGSTEIFFVVDNSPSMDFVTSTGETRKEIVLNSASQLVTSIFNSSNNIKIGLVDFHGANNGLVSYEPASINNATVRQELTNNKEDVLSSINDELTRSTSSGTNIEAGLKMAQRNFSKDLDNKIIILLTDGMPNADADGNDSGNDVTTEDAISIQNNTKQTLLNLKSDNIYTITMLTGMDESDGNTDKNGTIFTKENTLEEELTAAERIFGTENNPTADKYYLVKNTDINSIINNDILKDVSNKIQNPISTVKVVDYFPSDITQNFEFSYVGKPSIGTVSDSIDSQNNNIDWDIDILKGDEFATVRYKLKIKDMKNESLLNKVISTNEKVVLTYKDIDAKDYTITLDSSPKIQLSEVKEGLIANVSYDPNTETTEKVKATIKTNKKVNVVDGWELSEDGMILTKIFTENTTETVHLVDIDNMTKDVEISINNIKISSDNEEIPDGTLVIGTLPKTGLNYIIKISIIIFILILIFIVIKIRLYKDIK